MVMVVVDYSSHCLWGYFVWSFFVTQYFCLVLVRKWELAGCFTLIVFLADVWWLLVFFGSSSRSCGLVCSVWLWCFLIILTYVFGGFQKCLKKCIPIWFHSNVKEKWGTPNGFGKPILEGSRGSNIFSFFRTGNIRKYWKEGTREQTNLYQGNQRTEYLSNWEGMHSCRWGRWSGLPGKCQVL